jgi:hypothetical protein
LPLPPKNWQPPFRLILDFSSSLNCDRWDEWDGITRCLVLKTILLIMKRLQGFLRNFFANPLRQRLGFFANLRRTCEDFTKKPKLSLSSGAKKSKRKAHCLVHTQIIPPIPLIPVQTFFLIPLVHFLPNPCLSLYSQ